MASRLVPAALVAPVLAWALLGLAAAAEASSSCSADRSDGIVAAFLLGGAAAIGGLVLNLLPFRQSRDAQAVGVLVVAAVLVVALAAAVGLPLLFALLLLGVWRIAGGRDRGVARGPALAAYVASSLWFPVAGIAVLWGALRCFTF